jgi:hypothetical protein
LNERSASDCNQTNSKSNIINKVGTFIERVTGIEPALSAWEAVPSGPVTWPDLRGGVSVSDRERPLVTGVNGPLMARRTAVRPAPLAAPWSSPVLLDSCRPLGPWPSCQGSRSDRVRLGLDATDSVETIEQRGGRYRQLGRLQLRCCHEARTEVSGVSVVPEPGQATWITARSGTPRTVVLSPI